MGTILVAEDELAVRQLLRDVLEDEGHRVILADNGESAVELARSQRPDVAIVDLMLPALSGNEVIQQLRAEGMAGPVILISAAAAPHFDPDHVSRFIPKPFDIELVVESVRECLTGAATHASDGDNVADHGSEEAPFPPDERMRFIEMLSHDLRTPLTAVRGQIQLAQRRALAGADQSSIVQGLDQALRASDLLQSLIDDVLIVSNLRRGTLGFQMERVDLVAMARDAVGRAQMLASESTFELHASGAAWLQGDPRRLSQVLDNLLGNAVKYSPGGSHVVVSVRCDGGEVCVRVSDEGIGVPAGDVGSVFDAFYRGANAEQLSGSGLGLSISRELIARHGGRLWLDRTSDQGSTFAFALPLADDTTAD